MHTRSLTFALLALAAPLWAQQPAPAATTAATAATRDTTYIDADGTAHITRVIPIPDDLSLEARKSVARPGPDQEVPQSLGERRASQDAGRCDSGRLGRRFVRTRLKRRRWPGCRCTW